MTDLYTEKIEYLMTEEFLEIKPADYYRMMFPEGSFQKKDIDKHDHVANGLLQFSSEKKPEALYTRIIFDEHSVIDECVNHKNKFRDVTFAIVSGCSFYGKSRCDKNAAAVFAVVIDLDDVGKVELVNLMYLFQSKIAPMPTTLNVSGNGVHVVYMLSNPVTLTRTMKKRLTEAKRRLTELIWRPLITSRKKGAVEYQPLVQGYRMVGTTTKKGHICRSFLLGKKITYDTLLEAVGMGDIDDSGPTIDEAKEIWPEWYERRIVEGKPSGHISIGRVMYDKFLDAIRKGAVPGHRYFCIVYLGAIAQRCGISGEELEKDAFSLLELFDSRSDSEDNRFTETDIECALSAIKVKDYRRVNITTIEAITGITYPRRQKSDRKRGRPSLDAEIRKFIKANPKKTVTEIARECRISRTTVYKYLNNGR